MNPIHPLIEAAPHQRLQPSHSSSAPRGDRVPEGRSVPGPRAAARQRAAEHPLHTARKTWGAAERSVSPLCGAGGGAGGWAGASSRRKALDGDSAALTLQSGAAADVETCINRAGFHCVAKNLP